MEPRNIDNRTHFRRTRGITGDWQWRWGTRAPNGESVAVGGEGYDELRDAVHGFFVSQGIDPEAATLGSDYSQLEKFADNHYVITKYESVVSQQD